MDAEEVESSEGRTDPADTDRRLAAATTAADLCPLPPERMLELSSVAIKLLLPSTGLAADEVSRKEGVDGLDEVHSLVPWMRSTTLFH